MPNITAPDRLWGGEHLTLPLADTESGKIKSKAALRRCIIVIKELRRTRKNDLRRNREFSSTQKLPELKCTVSVVPLNMTNC